MKRETNEQFIKRIMREGSLCELFVIDALGKMAEAVATSSVEEIRKEFGPNSFISADGWHAAASYIKGEFDKKYKN